MGENKRIPHFEKILIGPMMVLGEMVCGGHYIESLKILKQSSGSTYLHIIKDLWSRYKFRGYYLGFYPWGLSQIVKGLPILFVQAEMHHLLTNYTNMSDNNRMLCSGVFGGISQGLFITPTQRLKTIVMTYPVNDGRVLTPFEVIKETYKRGGIRTFYSGLLPMVIRRGIDWGLRFQGYYLAENIMKRRNEELTIMNKVGCGVFGGALATITTPVDVCVAESQKYTNKGKSLYSIIKDVYNNYGYRGFVRGWGIRVVHSCYHTVWVCGIGSIMFSMLRD